MPFTGPPGEAGRTHVPETERVRDAARAGGLAAGLRRVLDAGRTVPCSARGRAVLPAGTAGTVPGWRLPGGVLPGRAARVRRLRHPLAATERLELVEVRPGDAGERASRARSDPAADAIGLAAVRIGVAEAALDRATAHLSGRTADGTPLAGRQLVQGAIADAVVALELCAAALEPDAAAEATAAEGTAAEDAAADVHRRLADTEWSIARLFGGSGYLLDGPARALYLARLVADAWTAPSDPGRWG